MAGKTLKEFLNPRDSSLKGNKRTAKVGDRFDFKQISLFVQNEDPSTTTSEKKEQIFNLDKLEQDHKDYYLLKTFPKKSPSQLKTPSKFGKEEQ